MTGMIKMITVHGLTVISRMTRMAGMTGMWVWMTEITRPMIRMTTMNGLTVMIRMTRMAGMTGTQV